MTESPFSMVILVSSQVVLAVGATNIVDAIPKDSQSLIALGKARQVTFYLTEVELKHQHCMGTKRPPQ